MNSKSLSAFFFLLMARTLRQQRACRGAGFPRIICSYMSPRYLSLYMLSITILRGGHFCSDCGLGISFRGRRVFARRTKHLIFVRMADVRLTNSTHRTQLLHHVHLDVFSCAPAAEQCRSRNHLYDARPDNRGSPAILGIYRKLCA